MNKIKKLCAKLKYIKNLRTTEVVFAIIQKFCMIALFIHFCYLAYMLGTGAYSFTKGMIIYLIIMFIIAMVLSYRMYLHQCYSCYEFSIHKNYSEAFDEFRWNTRAH